MSPQSPHRHAQPLIVSMIVVMLLGLGSRNGMLPMPKLLGNYPGDALWALMVFLLLALLRPRLSRRRQAFIALTTAFSVECLQLYQAPWLNEIRATTLGHWLLGQGFDWLDLCAYAVGISLGVLADTAQIFERRRHATNS